MAHEACGEAKKYLASGAPVGIHLADQLILPMVIAGRGSFRTLAPSRHTLTQIDLVRQFQDISVTAEKADSRQWLVRVGDPQEDSRGDDDES